MNGNHLALALATALVGTSLAPRSAVAAENEGGPPPSDPGRATTQFWGGLGVYIGTVMVGGAGVVAAAAPEDSSGWSRAAGYAGLGVMLAAPALTGATICLIGRCSPRHTGGCGTPIAAAYAGLLAATGLLMLQNGPAGEVALLGGLVGILVLPPAAAVAGWQLTKRPLSPPGGRDGYGREPPRPHTRAVRLAQGTLAVPLLAGSF